jgi:tRNA (adenine57-N1/adenine58-N1)-methyltransferase
MPKPIAKGDRVVLIDESGKKLILSTEDPTDKYKGFGVFDPSIFIGKHYGEQRIIGTKPVWILSPCLLDKLHSIKRKAQIILPRDAALILMYCSIETGNRVIEGGIGSGSLTIALAQAVAPTGQVISYDNREEFIRHAMKNLEKAVLDQYVITKELDITKGIEETDVDAVILDMPTPWTVVPHAWKALKPGGFFCSYSPLISQVEQTVQELRKHPFIEMYTIEHLQRNLVVSDHGTRPSFNMLGHTGYLTFARKIL